MFDRDKSGTIQTSQVAAILNTLGTQFDSTELAVSLEEADKEGKNLPYLGQLTNDKMFC